MDDSSQNGSPIQPPSQEQPAPHYQEYLSTDTEKQSKKRRKLMLLVIAGVSLILILAAVLAVALSGGNNDEKNQAVSSGKVVCSDEDCFSRNLAQCSPAEYTAGEPGNRLKYTITGSGELGCNTDIEYLEAQSIPDAAGKRMTCDFDNTVSFTDAARNTLDFPEDYGCSGDLLTPLKILNETKGES